MATTYELSDPNDDVVGQDQTVTTVYEDTLYDLANTYSLGSEELIRVNPGIDPWLPGAGKMIMIPGRHILPPGPHEGMSSICPNTVSTIIPSRAAASRASSSPIRSASARWIGARRSDSRTSSPRRKNPTWYPPESVRKEHAADGDPLPAGCRRDRTIRWGLCHASGGRQRHLS